MFIGAAATSACGKRRAGGKLKATTLVVRTLLIVCPAFVLSIDGANAAGWGGVADTAGRVVFRPLASQTRAMGMHKWRPGRTVGRSIAAPVAGYGDPSTITRNAPVGAQFGQQDSSRGASASHAAASFRPVAGVAGRGFAAGQVDTFRPVTRGSRTYASVSGYAGWHGMPPSQYTYAGPPVYPRLGYLPSPVWGR